GPRLPQLVGGGVESLGAACTDRHLHAFARQRRRAALAEALRCRTDDSLLAFDAEIHGNVLGRCKRCVQDASAGRPEASARAIALGGSGPAAAGDADRARMTAASVPAAATGQLAARASPCA